MTNSKATPETVNPGARVRLYPGVSCVTFTPTGTSGRIEEVNHFDVPDEDCEKGERRGFMVAWELVKATQEGESELFRPAIEDAAAILALPIDGFYAPSKRHAAITFLTAVEDILSLACARIDLKPKPASRLQWYEQDAETKLKALRKENAAFISSMTTKSKAVFHG